MIIKSNIRIIVFLLICSFFAEQVFARTLHYSKEYQLSDIFTEADRFGELEGNPPAITAYKDDQEIGYVFFTTDMYSGP